MLLQFSAFYCTVVRQPLEGCATVAPTDVDSVRSSRWSIPLIDRRTVRSQSLREIRIIMHRVRSIYHTPTSPISPTTTPADHTAPNAARFTWTAETVPINHVARLPIRDLRLDDQRATAPPDGRVLQKPPWPSLLLSSILTPFVSLHYLRLAVS